MPDEKSPPPIGHPQRRIADPAVIEMRDTLARVEGELKGVIGHLCPLERVSAHEERMAAAEERMLALDGRATALDVRLTTIGGAVTDVRQSVQAVQTSLASATDVERSERGLWLGQFGKLIETQGSGITQAIGIMGDRITDQAARIDRIGVKLENVMETNKELLSHQQNGLATAIASAVSTAVTTAATSEAQAHRIEVEADAAALKVKADADVALLKVQAEAEARRDQWLLKILQTQVLHVPLGGWLAIAAVVFALSALDAGIAQAVLDWLHHMIGGGE